jgi:hypothetical protein
MSGMEEFVAEVETFIHGFEHRLPPEDLGLVKRLTRHGEIGEAMVSLAWCIVKRELYMSPGQFEELLHISRGLIDESHLPPNLAEYVTVDADWDSG